MARRDHVDRVLGQEERIYVRNTSSAVECVNMGESMTMARPSDKAVKDIAAIVDFCLAMKPASASPGSADRGRPSSVPEKRRW